MGGFCPVPAAITAALRSGGSGATVAARIG